MTKKTPDPIRLLIVGFGKISAGNADDLMMGQTYRFASHIQGILACPDIQFLGVVDPSETAQNYARDRWGISDVFSTISQAIESVGQIDVLVLATPPKERLTTIKKCPTLKGVILEKPVAENYEEALELYEYCSKNKIAVDVHYWRRFVPQFQALASDGVKEWIGNIQYIQAFYGNGLHNNGIHSIDFIEYLSCEFASVQHVYGTPYYEAGPIKGDLNISFVGTLKNGVPVSFSCLDFSFFRENGIVLYGENGTLSIVNDSRNMYYTPLKKHEGLSGNQELAYESIQILTCDYDLAMRDLYPHIVDVIRGKKKSISPLESALRKEKIVKKVLLSMKQNGCVIAIDP